MAGFKSFEEIEVWQKSRVLANKIFALTLEGSFSKDFKLRDQINGSSGSIMDNIAEGFERGSKQEFIHFLSIAKGSAGETRSQLYRAFDQSYIDTGVFEKLKSEVESISSMLNKLMSYLNNSKIKGERYKQKQL